MLNGAVTGKHHQFVFTTRVRKDEIPSEIRILVLLAYGHRNTESVPEFTKDCNYG